MADDIADISPIDLATELTIAWLGNPNSRVNAEEVPAFIQAMYATVTALAGPGAIVAEPVTSAGYEPAVTERKSLGSKEHIISLIDGKPYKTLRRHLWAHGLTPDEYRARYGLKSDYPMVAPAYSEVRRQMAKSNGLARKPGVRMTAKPATSDTPAPKAPRGRPKKNA
ncbi:MAG: transcriptional regulator [Sphingomonas bacterium]|uniref:MucR family transcriptional regulator n=1 Tax=Sphingomonas bacterium TaxID=1895847 RepID=UPI0026344EF4|nr:MucR family transcriptional regulator [Sphingomonas bacterium]MDB5706141.1 transcriptional regulator [Sphingomonas bacterium]